MVTNTEDDEDSQEDPIDYKSQYRNFKRKLKFLIYENECFQEALRSNQRRMLKVTRDRSFLLDRLLNYEKVEASSSEGDDTESSDDEIGRAEVKRRRLDMGVNHYNNSVSSSSGSKTAASKKKKTPAPKVIKSSSQPQLPMVGVEGQMSVAEVERQLDSAARHAATFMDLDKPPSALPPEMFSNDPSLDSESNELCDLETSPSNLGEDCLNSEFILPD